jgi:hypothetical protein
MDKIVVELSPALAHMVADTFDAAKKRSDARFRYCSSVAGFTDELLGFAIVRLKSEWTSRDNYREAQELREVVAGKKAPTPIQVQLLEQALARFKPAGVQPKA